MKASIHLLPGPKIWHLSPITNSLAFLALLPVSWSSIIFSCLSCNAEQMALMSISACALVVRFLPWSISAGDGSPVPIRVVLKSAKTSWNDRVFELFESMFLTVCMCRSMKPLEQGKEQPSVTASRGVSLMPQLKTAKPAGPRSTVPYFTCLGFALVVWPIFTRSSLRDWVLGIYSNRLELAALCAFPAKDQPTQWAKVKTL